MSAEVLTSLMAGWAVFVFNAGSPGPSTMAIMGTALEHGRRSAMLYAAGVVTGSVFWGLVSALGVGLLLQTVGWALTVLKIAGALYLFWMAWKAWKAASAKDIAAPPTPRIGFYATALTLHLCNPKAVFGWAAVVAVGLPYGAEPATIAVLLSGCALLAVIVNFSYALAFSTAPMVARYRRARRWIQGSFAALFAAAGAGMLAWRP